MGYFALGSNGSGPRRTRTQQRSTSGAESPTPHPSDHVPLASGTSLEGLTRYARGRPQARVGRRAQGAQRLGSGRPSCGAPRSLP